MSVIGRDSEVAIAGDGVVRVRLCCDDSWADVVANDFGSSSDECCINCVCAEDGCVEGC